MDGVLDTWDLLQQQNEPVLTVKVCDEPLYCVRTNENGKFVSCGSKLGATFLIEVSENMIMSSKNDKPLLTAVSSTLYIYNIIYIFLIYYIIFFNELQMFERENRREKILEAKSRESKLKIKANHGQEQSDMTMLNGKVNMAPFASACEQAASEYFAAVEQERLRRLPGGKRR